MADFKMTLNSNYFESNALNTIRQLWNDQDFSDVTLATVDNQQIKAHKFILSSNSPFFRNILLNNPHQHPLLYLKGIRHRELEMVMQFIYLDECQVGLEELVAFLATGKDLMVNGLQEEHSIEDILKADTANTDQPYSYQKLKQTAPMYKDSNIVTGRDVGDVGKYRCDQCDKIYTQEQGLTRHNSNMKV